MRRVRKKDLQRSIGRGIVHYVEGKRRTTRGSMVDPSTGITGKGTLYENKEEEEEEASPSHGNPLSSNTIFSVPLQAAPNVPPELDSTIQPRAKNASN